MHERREHDGVGHRQDWWSIDDHPVERTGRQLMQERAHAIRRQQLRRVRRRVARRNHEEVRIAAALDDLAHPGLADEQFRKPPVVRQPHRLVQARAAHVGVDEQHARAADGERQRDVDRRRGLAFQRLRAGDGDEPRRVRAAARHQRGAQRAERFAEVVRHRTRQQRVPLAVDLRHEAEEIQVQAPGHVLGRLHRVVEVIDRECRRDAEAEAEENRHQPRAARVGRER